jgi:hypothetical protein
VPRENDGGVPDYAGRTHLQLRFHLRGRDLDPERVTNSTGVQPTCAFAKGERRGRSRESAVWQWWSAWWDKQDIDPLMDQLLQVLGPYRSVFRREVDLGAEATLSVVGEVYGVVIGSAEEADRRRYAWGDGSEPFEPFFASDRVGVGLNREVLEFLVDVGATFDTHIDPELDDGRPFADDE